MNDMSTAATGDLISRLRRIEGQVRGLQRMLEEGRDCTEVVTQIAAARAALDRVGHRVVALNLQHCLSANAPGGIDEHEVQRSLAALARLHG